MIYAIGRPGDRVRQFVSTNNETDREAQMKPGEVAIVVATPSVSMISLDGTTLLSIEQTIEERRRETKVAAKTFRDYKLNGTCDSPLGRVQCNQTSRDNINEAVTNALIDTENFTIEWRMADNTMKTHNATQLFALKMAMAQYINDCYGAYFAIADIIGDSNDPETINIQAGYPA
jgi:hypothetical protein